MTLTTEHVPIDTLRPHPENPRNGDIDLIAESLRINGQFKPIVVATDGTILAGNHTYAAAMSMHWDTLAVVRLPLDPDSPEARRIMLADNRTSDLGRYDDAQLLNLLHDLDDGLEGTGYNDMDVTVLLKRQKDPPPLTDFPTFDADLETQYQCPSCSYEWSGKPKATHSE